MKKFVIVNKNSFFVNKFKNTKYNNFIHIQKKKDLNIRYLKKKNPSIIFFPHWSYKVSESITSKYLCIGFHATPLPYGRGGTPIQNMILKGHSKTKICAIKLERSYDSGAIYKKISVSLNGSGSEIFKRLYLKILKMIISLSLKLPNPKKQEGKPTYFKRRKPSQSRIKKILNLNDLYDFIRIHDVNEENFPKANLKFGKFIYEFSNVKKIRNILKADVIIKSIKR